MVSSWRTVVERVRALVWDGGERKNPSSSSSVGGDSALEREVEREGKADGDGVGMKGVVVRMGSSSSKIEGSFCLC